MTTLALVESPVQLLHLIEWCHATGSAERTEVAVLAPRDGPGREQLRVMLEYAEEEGIASRWHEPRRGLGSLVATLAALRPQLRTATRLVVGDPFSAVVQLLLPEFRGDQLVVVDDGTATMEFTARLAERTPLLRWDAPQGGLRAWLRRPAARRACRVLAPAPGRPLSLFTVMPTVPLAGLAIHRNRYDWVRGRFGRPRLVPGTDIVGTSLVESGVVAAGPYLDQVAALAAGGSGRYYAHRREEPDKLARIAHRTGLQVIRPQVPLEVELRRGPVAERVVGFPSSVGYTLPVALAGVGARVELRPVDPAWLMPRIDSRTRQFLATITGFEPSGYRGTSDSPPSKLISQPMPWTMM